VAELVDALASGASGLTAVKVRVLSWAPHPVDRITMTAEGVETKQQQQLLRVLDRA
jgi:hypothetical protein